MSVADRLNKLSTDITNAYTSINNKGGTIPANKNTDNLHTAIDSIEIIEQATAEGESLSLVNTKAMPYSDYVVEGKSEQATSILPEGYTQVEYIESTGTQYIDTNYLFKSNDEIYIKFMPLEANVDKALFGQYDVSNTCELGYFGGKLRGNVGTGGPDYNTNTIYEVKNINGLWYYNNSSFGSPYNNNINNSCLLFARYYNGANKLSKSRVYSLIVKRNNNIILQFIPCYRNSDNEIGLYDIVNNVFYTNSGTGTFLKGNNVSMPSPEYPSDINSVADDVNLFDKEATFINGQAPKTVLDTGIRVTITTAGTNKWSAISIGNSELLGKTITIKTKIIASSQNTGQVYLFFGDSTTPTRSLVPNSGITSAGEQTKTVTIPSSFPSNCDKVYLLAYANGSGTGNIGDYVDYTNLKVQYGSTATPYSPYNQGTVTIKQRGKNLIDNNNLQYDFSNVPNTYNQLETIETGIRYSTTYSSGTPMIIFNTGIDLTSHIGKTIKMKSTISSNAGSIRVGIANADTSLRQYKANTNISNEEISFLVTDDLGEKKYLIYYLAIDVGTGNTADFKNLTLTIDEEPIYEPYQTPHDYTLQTAPLRSLPNGVKDTMELQDMQNHTRIGRQTGTLTETTTITLSDAKTNGAYMCNIKPSGTLTGKTIELEAGDYEIIYELAEEIIEPLTQNQATTMLDIIKTGSYEGTTNIYTDEDVKPTIGVGYYKKG